LYFESLCKTHFRLKSFGIVVDFSIFDPEKNSDPTRLLCPERIKILPRDELLIRVIIELSFVTIYIYIHIYAHIYVSNRDARIYLHNFKSSLLILTILYCIYIQAANMLTCKILQTVLERKFEKLIFSELPEKQKKNVETYVTLTSMQRQLGKTVFQIFWMRYTRCEQKQ